MLCNRHDKSVEQKWQGKWEEDKTYAFDERDTKRPVYSIDTPPPFTSGELHMGHVLSYSYFDFVARYKRMNGFNVYYPQGWDCQGFPTETKVEARYGRKPPKEFRELCIKWTGEYIEKMKGQMKALGFSPDWRYEYRTMDDDYHRRVQFSLLRMYEKDLVYKGSHPVFWCPYCNSALAKTDTEEMERETTLHYLIFRCKGKDLQIATTRPELLHACVAVLFNPADERYGAYSNEEIETPLGKKVKILPDKDVDMGFGSGLVMVCTFGDKQDIIWSYRHGLPVIEAMDERGMLINAGEFTGLKIGAAKEKIIQKLESEGKVIRVEKIPQVIKVHDRCKRPAELLLSNQWFIRLKGKEEKIIAAAKKMRWVPKFAVQYLVDWAEHVEWDWVISRQRYFGTPLPFWYCKKCGKTQPAKYEELPVNPPEMEKRKCSCGETLMPETSTLDCWVDSSITPLIIGRWPDDEEFLSRVYPASLRPQGVEIIRTWAFYTIYRCNELTGRPPFKELLLNGNVLAPDGKKMSKSLGNIISADALIDKYSADAVRGWSALSGAMAKDRPFSYQDIQYENNFLNKLLNAAKFVEMAIDGYSPDKKDEENLRAVDKWVLSRINSIVEDSTKNYEGFEFHHTVKTIQEFFWHEFCDFYLEYVKHRLYQPEKYGEESRRAAQYTLFNVLLRTIELLAPIFPHATEEIHQIFNKGSIHLSRWPAADKKMIDEKSEKTALLLNAIITEVRQHKAGKQLPLNAVIPSVTIHSDDDIDDIEEEIKATGRIEKLLKEKGEFSVVIG
jgi:valyl-tRNA synthetase